MMRVPILLSALLVALPVAARAQPSTFYAERGTWTVASGVKYCRALNRPAEDFNYAPYNALQIAVDAKGAIAAEVFFWPGALPATGDLRLRLNFPTRKEPIILNAKATMGDFMLASDPDPALWRAFQDAPAVEASLDGAAAPILRFGLPDMMWVLNALTICKRVLPKT